MPVADSAPILQNFTYPVASMLRSTPPVTAASKSPACSPRMAADIAASPEAHAASVVKLGPRKLNRFATRPAITFASSPGMVSSVISSNPARNEARVSASTASRTGSGSAANDGAAHSSRANLGNWIRRLLRCCLSPPMALPMMTATRSGSTVQSGQPASSSAERVPATAHFWPSSIWVLTAGGTGSRHASGSQEKSRTHPPMREYVLSGACGSGS